MEKKILHVINGIGSGGIEKVIFDWKEGLRTYKITFDFLLRKNNSNLCNIPELKDSRVYVLKSRHDALFKRYHELSLFFSEHKEYDCIHIHLSSWNYILEILLAKKHGIKKVIVHSHGSDCNKLKDKIVHYINRLFLPFVANVRLACSEKAGKWMFGSCRFKTVHNGINAKKFAFDSFNRNETRKTLDIDDKIVVGSVARLSPEKNHKFIIDVFCELEKRKPNSVLLLIGEGREKESIDQYIESKNIGEKIISLGVRNDVEKLMFAMDVLLFPSKHEGFPLVPIEAQCAGLPCVTSDRITKQVKITELLTFCSLDESVEKWADVVMGCLSYQRISHSDAIIYNNLDSEAIISSMKEIYLK